ncbi:hypothetical protein DPMN_177865 [Dreissena polymorpha]|uniref:Uncharacterized protein n=1 Tax=Dreissena polymorpha TaxID=45954 RepID=A0A9D4EBV3_DREPO|nr:hypothetical protein DPMN_177865 [Dreissena polymorpha]
MNTSLFNSQAPGSGVHLATTATFSAPWVSSTLPRCIPLDATPLNQNTFWIQQSSGHFVPFTTDSLPTTGGFQSQSADLVSGRPSFPALFILVPANDPLMLEGREIPPSGIPPTVFASYMQTTGFVDGSAEADLEANVEAEHYYLASIHQVCKLMFKTLDDDFCPRPSLSATGSGVTITELVA